MKIHKLINRSKWDDILPVRSIIPFFVVDVVYYCCCCLLLKRLCCASSSEFRLIYSFTCAKLSYELTRSLLIMSVCVCERVGSFQIKIYKLFKNTVFFFLLLALVSVYLAAPIKFGRAPCHLSLIYRRFTPHKHLEIILFFYFFGRSHKEL